MSPESIALTRRAKPRKGARDAEATRDEILLAAMMEFSEKGLHGARVEEIAARTATSKHMIYYYFGSKDGLYSAVLIRAYEDFRRAEASVDYSTLDPVEAVRVLVSKTFDAHVFNPHVIRILMSENLDKGRHVEKADHTGQRALVLDTTAEILSRGVDAGLFRDDFDALQFHMNVSALSFFSVANRYTFGRVFQFDMLEPDFIDRRRNEVIDTMLSRCLKRDG